MVLATRYGVRATRSAHRGEFGTCVALDGEKIINIPLQEAVGVLKTVPMDRWVTAQAMFGAIRQVHDHACRLLIVGINPGLWTERVDAPFALRRATVSGRHSTPPASPPRL